MKGKLLFLPLLLCLLSSLVAFAESPPVLSWTDICIEANAHHPDLRSAQEKIRQATLALKNAQSAMFPQVSLSGSLSDKQSYSLGINARQLLYDGLKTQLGIDQTRLSVTSARWAAAATSAQLRYRLRTAFINLWKQQELLTLSKTILARREQNLKLVQLLYDGGKEHLGALLTSKAQLFQARSDLTQQQRLLTVAQHSLSLELNWPETPPIQVTGNFALMLQHRYKTPDLTALVVAHPSIKSLELQQQIATLNRIAVDADGLPSLYASGGDQWGGTLGQASTPGQWSANLSLSLTLWDSGARAASVEKADAVSRQLEWDLMSTKRQLRQSLESEWISLQNAQDQIEEQKQFLGASEVRAKIADAEYANGLLLFDNWSTIEDSLISTRQSLLNAQASALQAESSYIQAQGGSLEHN
jgi:outer membrane protein TolC